MNHCELCTKRRALYNDVAKIKAQNEKNVKKGIFTHLTIKQKVDINNSLIKKGEKNLIPIGKPYGAIDTLFSYAIPFYIFYAGSKIKNLKQDKRMLKAKKLAEKGAKVGCTDCMLRMAQIYSGDSCFVPDQKRAQKYLDMAKKAGANTVEVAKTNELVVQAKQLRADFNAQASAYAKSKAKKIFAVAAAATYGAVAGGLDSAVLAGVSVATGASATDVILGMDTSGSSSGASESKGTVKLEKRTAGEFYYFYPENEPGSSGIRLANYDPRTGKGETETGSKIVKA